MNDTHINPSPENIAALRAMDLDGPVIMLNLLRFSADGGEAQYRRYGAAAMPFLVEAGASIRYLGDVAATVIGGEAWDEIVLVEYPSLQAFFEMTGNPAYPSDIRSGALADSRLYCTQETVGASLPTS
jgi:uncharacterized protein (DUF1330 family)